MRELLKYKQELVLLGLLSLVLLLVRWVSATLWPTTGQYDMAAQTETVFWTILRVVIYALAAWMGLRAVAPKAYMHLKHNVVDQFDKLGTAERDSFSLRMFGILFFGLVLLAMSGCTPANAATPVAVDQRTCVTRSAAADVGVREASGRNDGPEVERYLAHVGLGPGYAWCAAFVSYHLDQCGVDNPRSAWSPAFALAKDQVWSPRKAIRSPRPGDVFSIWFPRMGRVGHVGLVTGFDGKYINTIEGNSSGPGSREGDGVYARRRQLSKIHAITNYIHDDGGIGAGPAGLRGGDTRAAADRLQGQARPGGASQRYAADRGAFRLTRARYLISGAAQPGGSLATAANPGHGPAAHHGAQRAGLEHGVHQPRYAHAQRGLRHTGTAGHPVGPLEAGEQRAHRGTRAHRNEGGARNAPVGVVGPGHLHHLDPLAAAALAAAPDKTTVNR